MNQVLFKVDDFLSDEFHREDNSNIVFNLGKFFGILSKYEQIKVSLGVIGSSLDKIPDVALTVVRDLIDAGKVELFNHSFTHSPEPVTAGDMIEGDVIIAEYFQSCSDIYGAPRNDISLVSDFKGTLFKRDIPISAYQELENVMPESFVDYDNFISKYQKEHDQVKVYQMHPWVWSDTDFQAFERVLQIMVNDNKEWIFASEYAR